MTTYDEWKSTEPEDPFADELELERRDAEMEPDEPNSCCPTCGWQGLRNEPQFCACPECKTFPLRSSSNLVEMGEDEPEYDGSELDDHTCSTSAPRKLHQMDYSYVERKARREDGLDYDFNKEMKK